MSLDVKLISRSPIEVVCEECGNKYNKEVEYYSANITHNLNRMADKAGIYEALWRPDEIGISVASELIPLLQDGLKKLLSKPKYYEKYNSPNGWGMYEHFVPFVEKYLYACIEYPDAIIKVSR